MATVTATQNGSATGGAVKALAFVTGGGGGGGHGGGSGSNRYIHINFESDVWHLVIIKGYEKTHVEFSGDNALEMLSTFVKFAGERLNE